MKKFLSLIAVLSLLLALAACGAPVTPPDVPCEDDPSQEKCQEEPPIENGWELNKTGFDGKGMTVNIKVYPKEEYDPFDPNYTGDYADVKQQWQDKVEKAYNIDIQYVNYGDSEGWGPARVTAIVDGHINQTRIGDIYLVATEWIPTLAKSQAVASLYQTEAQEGYFADFGVDSAKILRDIATYRKNVYAYLYGTPRPDYFMYFNKTLVDQAGLEDPAQMWLDHEWTWSNFKAYLDQAKATTTFAPDTYKLLTGQATEYWIGFTAAQGGNFVHPVTNNLMWTNNNVLSIASELKAMFDKKYIDSDTNDTSTSFINGTALFATGGLWFVGSKDRFSSDLPFEIGAVPYPVADDAAQTWSTYKAPVYASSAYAVANVENGLNGINSKVLFNILDDLTRGIVLPDNELTPDEAYRMWLETKFDRPLYVDTIMSVQDPKYQYFEKVFLVSMTVGNGSHYSGLGMYPILNAIIKTPEKDPRTELDAITGAYEAVLADFK